MSRENYRILLVDDERSVLLLLKRIIEDEGFTVESASDGKEALHVAETFVPHMIITDIKMPVMDGMELMKRYKAIDADADFIVLTAFGTVDTAIQSMKMGVLDYILKPLKEPDELRHAIHKAYERRRLLDENSALKIELDKGMPPTDIVFAGMEEILDDINAVAPTNSTVLLSGETGTGKNVVAKVIHRLSTRQGPFVEVNCASVPENLLESEFFGHEKGAFTGAVSSKKGKFEIATDGTILLDEISEMDARLQAKLLKVLQDGTFERVGSNMQQKTDARIICATNRDLEQEVAEGRFREDLYFRLNVFPVRLKPLRDRSSDMERIVEYLMKTVSVRIGKKIMSIKEQDMKKIIGYAWPGNIRELQNVIERAVILSKGEELDMSRILLGDSLKKERMAGTLDDIEKQAIEDALQTTDGNRKRAAENLGISLRSLQYKIKEYGIKK